MTEKERLISLMKEVNYPVSLGSRLAANFGTQHQDHIFEVVADHLLANGVVPLPCKPGDTVYEVRNNTSACSGCHNYEGIYGTCDTWCTKIKDGDLRWYPDISEKPLCEKQFMEVVEEVATVEYLFNHRACFGKTVFLTRADAEAALVGLTKGEGEPND